jgi:tRNA (guanosine-2'-O-)-methyltransferase
VKRSASGVFAPVPLAPLPFPAPVIIAALSPVVLDERKERIERAVAARIPSVVCVIESLADPHNAAAILRTCEGFGVGEVHAIEHDARVLITTRVTKGCEKWMNLRRYDSPKECAAELHARGMPLYVADMRADRSVEDLAAMPRVALAFGNEHAGISQALRQVADGTFAVPMRGMVESFNVSVATAVALYAVTCGRSGELGKEEAAELRARFLMESVREPELIVERYVRDARQKGLA